MRIIFCLIVMFAGAAYAASYQTVTVHDEPLTRPWAVTAMPTGGWLITERAGALVHLFADGKATRHNLELPDLYNEGQGGLLDVAFTKDFAVPGTIVLTYTAGSAQNNQLVVATATLSKTGVQGVSPILRVQPGKATPVHFGGRLARLADGTWLVTTGDGFDYREQAQVLTSQMGKILRFHLSGEPVADPPFNEAPYVYSLGHRNPQGLVVAQETIYAHEHGPDGGDEINIIKAGKNYGWPVVTNGDDYSGARISPYRDYPGMRLPLYDWTPSVAPSSMIYYTHARFPQLQNKLVITTLADQTVLAVDISASPVRQDKLDVGTTQRWRDVAMNADGQIVLLPDGDKVQLLQLKPVEQ